MSKLKTLLKTGVIIYSTLLLIYTSLILLLTINPSKYIGTSNEPVSTDNIKRLISALFTVFFFYFMFLQGLGLLIFSFLTRKVLFNIFKVNIILSILTLMANFIFIYALFQGLGYNHQKLGGFNTPQDDWWNALYSNLNLVSISLNIICPLIICFLVLKTEIKNEL